MDNILLFDNPIWRNQLKPLTLTRPISHLRIGIITIIEKWERFLDCDISCLSEPYLQSKFTPKYADEKVESDLMALLKFTRAFE